MWKCASSGVYVRAERVHFLLSSMLLLMLAEHSDRLSFCPVAFFAWHMCMRVCLCVWINCGRFQLSYQSACSVCATQNVRC